MIKIGYEYPSDKSIQPSVDIPVVVTVSNNFSLSEVGIVEQLVVITLLNPIWSFHRVKMLS